MEEINALTVKFKEYFPWHQTRIVFFSQFVLALLRARSTNLCLVAEEFQGPAKTASAYKRIQRFFKDYDMSFQSLGQLIIKWLPMDQYILCMDRTNWKFGKQNRRQLSCNCYRMERSCCPYCLVLP